MKQQADTLHPSIGDLQAHAIKTLTDVLGKFTALQTLEVDSCSGLAHLVGPHEQMQGLQTLQRLHIVNCDGLATLPKSISQLTALQELKVTKCSSLTDLPDTFGQLPALQTLELKGCSALHSLPETIGQLPALQQLWLDDCSALTQLPMVVGKLAALRTLWISHCGLEGLPTSFGHLRSLILLGCSKVQCMRLGQVVGANRQPALESVSVIGCHSLQELSLEVLPRLERLEVQRCAALQTLRLQQQPALKRLALERCTSLDQLSLADSPMPALEELVLDECGLTDLPAALGSLSNLKELKLSALPKLTRLPAQLPALLLQLPKLHKVNISGCRVFSEAAESLSAHFAVISTADEDDLLEAYLAANPELSSQLLQQTRAFIERLGSGNWDVVSYWRSVQDILAADKTCPGLLLSIISASDIQAATASLDGLPQALVATKLLTQYFDVSDIKNLTKAYAEVERGPSAALAHALRIGLQADLKLSSETGSMSPRQQSYDMSALDSIPTPGHSGRPQDRLSDANGQAVLAYLTQAEDWESLLRQACDIIATIAGTACKSTGSAAAAAAASTAAGAAAGAPAAAGAAAGVPTAAATGVPATAAATEATAVAATGAPAAAGVPTAVAGERGGASSSSGKQPPLAPKPGETAAAPLVRMMWYVTDRKPCRSGGELHSFSNRLDHQVHVGQVVFGRQPMTWRDILIRCLHRIRGWEIQEINFVPTVAAGARIQHLLGNIQDHYHTQSQVLVVIHGFSITFEKAVRSAARLANQLNFTGPVIVYSWASWGSWFAYVLDKGRVQDTIDTLRTLLECCSSGVRMTAGHLTDSGPLFEKGFDCLGGDAWQQ
jgi:Leucine-rich repeat (LRR) protein